MSDDEAVPPGRFRTAQVASYRFKDVRVPYRAETMAVSEPERRLLLARLASDCGPVRPRPAPSRTHRKLILDTDLGTDADDALALLLLLHLPPEDVELLGVTTVYGYSHVRARVTERIALASAQERGRLAPPVLAGESTPLGTHMPVWHTGFEGHEVLAPGEIEELKRRADFDSANGTCGDHAAARFIVEQVRRHPGEVTLACIGVLSNVAMALALDPDMARHVPRIVFMGTGTRLPASPECLTGLPFRAPREPVAPGEGVPWLHYPNLNLVGDTLAAMHVFASGIPIDVVGHAVTSRLWWGAPDEQTRAACAALRQATSPADTAVVGRLLDVWLRHRTAIFGRPVGGTCPHDPLTVAEAVYPGRFVEFGAPGHLLVHEWAAFGTFVCGQDGPHRLARAVHAQSFLGFLGERLVSSQPCPP